MLAMRSAASDSFSPVAAWVLCWKAWPSFTSASNTLPPSSCALAKAPSPACQIWLAESRKALSGFLSFGFAVMAVSSLGGEAPNLAWGAVRV